MTAQNNLREADINIGVDLSQWQDHVDFHALSEWASFAILRTGDGMRHQDLLHHFYAAQARLLKLPIAHYHVLRPGETESVTAANAIINAIGPRVPGEPYALDLEDEEDVQIPYIEQVARMLKTILGKPPLIYTNKYLFGNFDWRPVLALDCGMWLADPDGSPAYPANVFQWPFAAIKQYSNKAHVPGVVGEVDTNAFYGSITQFKQYG